MRKVLLIAAMMMLLATGASANDDLSGRMAASGFLGYSLGFGEGFDDWEESVSDGFFSYSAKLSRSAGIGYGLMFHYGMSEKLMLGGELSFQSYSYDYEYNNVELWSTSESGMNFLASVLYAMNYDETEGGLFLMGGAGLYGGPSFTSGFGADDSFGFFGGVKYEKKFGEQFSGFVMPRFHVVMFDDMAMMLQVAVGGTFDFGSN